MEPFEDLLQQIQELKAQIQQLRTMQEVQQESITSLIALSQQQTTVIDRQTAVIQSVVSR
ncbi:MAG: hypothetical protein SAJ12_02130 [Jaaginema sp. PMC 1079.18]|nr:hypothetical protein [Jaaginema sp. PMC 1080.18]MEC4849786.1 hypothetical protein [Jaaginema sp. PMC 1079.18]MEC4865711.1 hypothetical protein [Jaaginema sp. PMC 1078.18]